MNFDNMEIRDLEKYEVLKNVKEKYRNLLLLDILNIEELFEDLKNERFKNQYNSNSKFEGVLGSNLFVQNKIQFNLLKNMLKVSLWRYSPTNELFIGDELIILNNDYDVESIAVPDEIDSYSYERIMKISGVTLLQLLEVKEEYKLVLEEQIETLEFEFYDE